MTFNPKTWLDGREGNTRLDAEALIDLEVRLSTYTDEQVEAGGGGGGGGANLPGTPNNPITDPDAERPTGLESVWWRTDTIPTNSVSGDVRMAA